MNKFVATIHFDTTDNPEDPQYFERLITELVSDHGLEITDVHVEKLDEELET